MQLHQKTHRILFSRPYDIIRHEGILGIEESIHYHIRVSIRVTVICLAVALVLALVGNETGFMIVVSIMVPLVYFYWVRIKEIRKKRRTYLFDKNARQLLVNTRTTIPFGQIQYIGVHRIVSKGENSDTVSYKVRIKVRELPSFVLDVTGIGDAKRIALAVTNFLGIEVTYINDDSLPESLEEYEESLVILRNYSDDSLKRIVDREWVLETPRFRAAKEILQKRKHP